MHVLQWIAVKDVEDKDMAIRTVRNNLEEYMGSEYATSTWYDWFVTGGGRWNTQENDDDLSAYREDKTNMVISFEEEPDLFEERVLLSLEARKAEFDSYAKDVKPEIITNIISSYNPREVDWSVISDIYPIKKVIDMAYGEWDFNSYFYDMESNTTTPKYMFEAIDKGDKNWYLIPVDFHF